MKRYLLPALLLYLFSSVYLSAALLQKETTEEKPTSDVFERLNKFINEEKKKEEGEISTPILPDKASLALLDETTKEQYFLALRGYYQYRISGYIHRKSVFKWQLLSTKVIFGVVILLVLAGVYFSGVQFHKSLKWKQIKGASEEEERTEIEASLTGIKVSSPILGVIILTISFLFFYLYLVHVYPITEIF
jgi:hypothetical protein